MRLSIILTDHEFCKQKERTCKLIEESTFSFWLLKYPVKDLDNNGAQSEYIERYKEYEINGGRAPTNHARANNFTVTNPDNGTDYTSEFKEKYPEHQLGFRGDPSALKKKHADKNFVFGYDGPDYGTNYKDDYLKKQAGDRTKPVNQKQPHICLGDALTDFSTTYKQVHDPKQGQRRSAGDPQAIRKSNMILGNDHSNFQTQNNATYIAQPITNYHITQKSNTSSINLGADKNGYMSENKGNFYHKQAPAQPVDKNRVLDFKSAHFQLGFPQDSHVYTSEAMRQYEQKPINFNKAVGNRDSQFDLNVDGKNYFNSTYGNQFTGKNGEKAPAMKNIGQIDNILMGCDSDPNQYVSEAKGQFGNKNGDYERVQGKKQGGSLQLGQGEGDFLTHNQLTYQDRFGQKQNCKLTPEQLARLKGLSLVTGFQNPDYHITSQSYGMRNGNANVLSKQTLNAMKNTNIIQGDENPFKGNTTYKTSFHWKKGDQ